MKSIIYRVQSLPDLTLSKNREIGVTANYLLSEFENLFYTFLNLENFQSCDILFFRKDGENAVYLKITITDEHREHVTNLVQSSPIKGLYNLLIMEHHHDFFRSCPLDICYATSSKNMLNELELLKARLLAPKSIPIGNPFLNRLWYLNKIDFQTRNTNEYIFEILTNAEGNFTGCIYRFIKPPPEKNFADFREIVQKQILQLFYRIKTVESAKVEGGGFDNPIKELFRPAGEWIKDLINIYADTRSAYFELIFFSDQAGNAPLIGNQVLANLTEQRNYSLVNNQQDSELLECSCKLPHHNLLSELTAKSRNDTQQTVDLGGKTGIADKYLEKLLTGKNDQEKYRIREYFNCYLENILSREELSPLFRFIIPVKGDENKLPLESYPRDIAAKGIIVGEGARNKEKISVPVNNLAKNTFITGMPGTGKTTVVLNMLAQLFHNDVGFLCIEPVKAEYRSILSIDRNRETEGYRNWGDLVGEKALLGIPHGIQLYTPGNERISPFRFNPFIVPTGISVEEHIKSLLVAFEATFSMSGPVRHILEEMIIELYMNKAISGVNDLDRVIEKGFKGPFPMMNQLYNLLTSKKLDGWGYSGDFKNQLVAFFDNRLKSLTRFTVGKIFTTQENSFGSISDILGNRIILEMDALSEYESNLLTMFLLTQLRNVIRKGALNKGLRHVVVLEEAHNIVGIDSMQHEEGMTNPKEAASKFVIRMMAELRAFGEGFIIADQFPSAVHPMIVKNTSTKIAHRVVSEEDQEQLGNSMLLTESQKEMLVSAGPGDAFLFMEGWLRPQKIKEPHFKEIYNIEDDTRFFNESITPVISSSEWYQRNQEVISNSQKIWVEIENRRYLSEEKFAKEKLKSGAGNVIE